MGRAWTVAVLATLALSAPSSAQRERRGSDEFRSRLDTTVALARDGTVDLSLVSGEIIVTSWDRSEVRVRATTEDGILRFDASPSRVSLGVRSYRGDMGDTRYEVTIPASARLTARGVSGSISANGGSNVEAHSVSGEVEVANVSGSLRIETVSGDVHAEHVGDGVRASSVSGEIIMADVTGDVDAQSVSGDIILDGVRSSYVRTESTSGDVHYEGPLDIKGRYEFNSHSGDIELIVPRVGATLDVETFSGDVESDYPMTLAPGTRKGGRGKGLRFTIDGGGARISARTFSGDIIIQRASGANREE